MSIVYNYNFVYKTTCIITNKYYYGVHSTNNLNDGYLGSGDVLSRSINKYGVQNHKREILEFFDNRTKTFKKEKEIVNKDMLKDPLCMNLCEGGKGSEIKNTSEEVKNKLKIIMLGKNKGKTAWNKGLTKETDNRVKKNADSKKGGHWSEKAKENQKSEKNILTRKIAHKKNWETRRKNGTDKGFIPWNKGLKDSQVAWNKGLTKETDSRLKMEEKTKQKISNTTKGKKKPPRTKKHIENLRKSIIISNKIKIHNEYLASIIDGE